MTLRLAFVLVLTLFPLVPARACDCGPRQPPGRAMAQYDGVFSGEVIDVTPGSFTVPGMEPIETLRATVKVIKSWKGNFSGTVLVQSYGDCGVEFTADKYLFYVLRSDKGEWFANICSRTALLKDAEKDVLELDGKRPVPTGTPQEPTLDLQGRSNLPAIPGLVFVLRNRLHQRIYFVEYGISSARMQIRRKGRWIDYGCNYSGKPRLFSRADLAHLHDVRKEMYDDKDLEGSLSYFDPQTNTQIHAGDPPEGETWRFGVQYLTDEDIDAGKRLQDSRRFVWSETFLPEAPVESSLFKKVSRNHRGSHPDSVKDSR